MLTLLLGPLEEMLAAGGRLPPEERAGLALEIDAPPLPAPVQLDRDMWEKIVLNLSGAGVSSRTRHRDHRPGLLAPDRVDRAGVPIEPALPRLPGQAGTHRRRALQKLLAAKRSPCRSSGAGPNRAPGGASLSVPRTKELDPC